MLLKGCQRRSVCLRARDSRLFEEVFFVLRSDAHADGGDILAEANRILEENLQKKTSHPRRRLLGTSLAFLAGFATAALIALILAAAL